jgi:hypothetical protein
MTTRPHREAERGGHFGTPKFLISALRPGTPPLKPLGSMCKATTNTVMRLNARRAEGPFTCARLEDVITEVLEKLQTYLLHIV